MPAASSIMLGILATSAFGVQQVQSGEAKAQAKKAMDDKQIKDDALIKEQQDQVKNKESIEATTVTRDMAKARQKQQILGAQGRQSTNLAYSPGKTLLGS